MYQKGIELSTYPPQETGCLTRLVPGAWNSPLSTTVQVVLAGRKAGQRNKGGSSSGGRHDAHSEGQVVGVLTFLQVTSLTPWKDSWKALPILSVGLTQSLNPLWSHSTDRGVCLLYFKSLLSWKLRIIQESWTWQGFLWKVGLEGEEWVKGMHSEKQLLRAQRKRTLQGRVSHNS